MTAFLQLVRQLGGYMDTEINSFTDLGPLLLAQEHVDEPVSHADLENIFTVIAALADVTDRQSARNARYSDEIFVRTDWFGALITARKIITGQREPGETIIAPEGESLDDYAKSIVHKACWLADAVCAEGTPEKAL